MSVAHLAAERGRQPRPGVVDQHDQDVRRILGQPPRLTRCSYTDSCIVRPAMLADGVGGNGNTSDELIGSPQIHAWNDVLLPRTSATGPAPGPRIARRRVTSVSDRRRLEPHPRRMSRAGGYRRRAEVNDDRPQRPFVVGRAGCARPGLGVSRRSGRAKAT